MGDVADMMLDGTLDIETGEYIGNACGYPRTQNSFRGLPCAGSFLTSYEKYRSQFLKDIGFKQQLNGSWLTPDGKVISNKRIHKYLTKEFADLT